MSETWLNLEERAIESEIHELGYNLISRSRGSRGGGVAILLKNSFNHVETKHSFSSFECVETLITHSQIRPLRLLSIYRPPSGSTSTFLEEFESLLHGLSERSGELVIAGDFNIHVHDISSVFANSFLGIVNDHFLHQFVNGATHVAGGTLDLVLARAQPDSAPISHVREVMIPAVPDHALVTFNLHVGALNQKKQFVSVKTRNMKSLDINEFRCNILKSPLCDVDHFPDNLDDTIELYDELLAEFLDELAPITDVTVPERSGPKWYNSECQAAKRRRRKAERKYRVTLKKSVCVKQLVESLRSVREEAKAATALIVKTRNEYYRNQLDEAGNDSRKTYRIMNGLLGKVRNPSTLPEFSNEADLCQQFMNFFKEKIDKIYAEIQAIRCDDDEELTGTNDLPEFRSFHPVSSEELTNIIRSMNYKKCDLDPVPSKLIGTCLNEVMPVLKSIVNGSLTSGVFPSVLKKAVIRPVYKGKGLDVNSLSSYRPISNLSFLSKIIEKCVAHQLTEYLESHDLFASVQSAYRGKHSCETATLRIFNDLLVLTDKRKKAVLLLLDLSAAFDTVPHSILLHRLEHKYGVKGTCLDWFTSYLQGRSAVVKIGESQSCEVEVSIGVPQGSILGPLLFILFTKDLEKIAARNNVRIHLYADDSQLYASFTDDNWVQCEGQLRKCFADVERWMASSFLKLNPSKTELLFISSKCDRSSNPIAHDESLTLGGGSCSASVNITPSQQARNLGVIFDQKLTMKSHISKIVKDCNLSLMNLRRIGDKLTMKHKIQLVHSLIHSRIDYCNGLLIGADKSDLNRLQMVQNAATRFVFGRWKRRGVTELRAQLHFLPVEARIEFKICLMVFKSLNNLAPSYLANLIQTRKPKGRSLRHDEDGSLLEKDFSTKLKSSQQAFQVCGPKLWNVLPVEIRNCSDEVIFKSRLKTHLYERFYGH